MLVAALNAPVILLKASVSLLKAPVKLLKAPVRLLKAPVRLLKALVRLLEIFYRIITGAFDKTVKIWSVDGKLVHRLEGFLNTITGVCYVPRNKTLWVASGHSNAQLYDPKSGDNVSR